MESQGSDLRSLFGLEGKHVLATGATSLITVWTARLMLQAGARLTLTDRVSEEEIRRAHARFAADKGDPGLDLAGSTRLIGNADIRNLRKSDAEAAGHAGALSVEEMVGAALDSNGPIDVLVNIAGGQEPIPAENLTPEIFQKTLSRILLGTWNVIFEVFHRCMKERGGAHPHDHGGHRPGIPANARDGGGEKRPRLSP